MIGRLGRGRGLLPQRWRDRLLLALGRDLHVRRSELDRTLRTAGLACLLGCALYTAFSGAQAIFLEHAGASRYPLFFVILALTVWPGVALTVAANRRWGIGRAFRYNLLLNALAGVAIYVSYRVAENAVVSFIDYVAYSVLFELVMLQFWAFVSQYFNILEAKRIFPVIAAGSGLGYIFSGALTTLIATRLGAEPLVFVWSAGCALSVLFVYWTDRRLYRPHVIDDADELEAEATHEQRRLGLLRSVGAAFAYLRKSRLVLALVLLATVLLIAMRVSDYLVATVFVRATNGQTELAVLLGWSWMLSYVVQLALGLWITPVVLGRLGVRNAILVLPAATLLGFVLVAALPGLPAALFLFVVRNGIQTGLDDPAENVLGGALPNQVAPKLKLIIDNLVLPGSAVIAGLGLLLAEALFGASSIRFLAGVGVVACLGFLAAALWVRSLYVSAIYSRLRSHTLSLSDLELALGRPGAKAVEELKAGARGDDPNLREFAARALARVAPESFLGLVEELAVSTEPALRRLAYELPPPGSLSLDQLEKAAGDGDPWVEAAAAVAGAHLQPPWSRSPEILARLDSNGAEIARAASVWAAAEIGDHHEVAEALADLRPGVRLEAVRSFARLKGAVPGSTAALIACLQDTSPDVRREALRQAARWKPPPEAAAAYEEALVAGLTSADPLSRRLAGQAIAVQSPGGLEKALGLLAAETSVAVAAMEAVTRSGRADLVRRAQGHLETLLKVGTETAETAARLRSLQRLAGPAGEDSRLAMLRISLEDYVGHVVEMVLAGLRSLHDKKGFGRVERALRSTGETARVEAVETLLNFGPARLVEPLVRLLEPDAFESGVARPLSETEVAMLTRHPDGWVRKAAEAVQQRSGESMNDLIALKKVPLFATLTLEQLAAIDRLMVTRHYLAGEAIFKWGELSDELYVITAGEVRIHRDDVSGEVTLARLGEHETIGEMAPFTHQPRSAGADAISEVTVRVLRRERLEAILHEHPEVLLEVIKNLSQRLVVANEQLEAAARARREPEAPARKPRHRQPA
ncbi:MAG: cyclic nucleotide-binding domain-containing protein [Chloroflexi bacterium]|nr:MAG: cyclic nucleotide-binding domain-containing protein [Chloroflexota bacterium]